MDSHSISNYRTLFSALSSIVQFFSVLSFSSACKCARCTKKTGSAAQADPVLFVHLAQMHAEEKDKTEKNRKIRDKAEKRVL